MPVCGAPLDLVHDGACRVTRGVHSLLSETTRGVGQQVFAFVRKSPMERLRSTYGAVGGGGD